MLGVQHEGLHVFTEFSALHIVYRRDAALSLSLSSAHDVQRCGVYRRCLEGVVYQRY